MPRHKRRRQEGGSTLFIMSKGLAVAALLVRVDGEVIFDMVKCVEVDEVVDSKRLLVLCSGDSKNHGGMGLRDRVLWLGQPVGDLADSQLGFGLLDGGGYS